MVRSDCVARTMLRHRTDRHVWKHPDAPGQTSVHGVYRRIQTVSHPMARVDVSPMGRFIHLLPKTVAERTARDALCDHVVAWNAGLAAGVLLMW